MSATIKKSVACVYSKVVGQARHLPFILFYLFFFAASIQAQDHLIILSPHQEGIKYEFGRAFSDWYKVHYRNSVTLDWRDMGGTADDLRFILSEYQHSSNSIGLDLFFGGGLDPYLELKQKNVLESYRPDHEILEGIPKQLSGLPLYDEDGFWFGSALSTFGILKNERVVRAMNLPSVSTWKDLTDPALKGWVGAGDPRNSGVSHMIFECILQAYGWKEGWKVILNLGQNIRQFDRNGSASAKSCALGNVAYALVVDFYGFTQISEVGKENMNIIIPKRDSVVSPDCIAMLKGAPHAETAKRFIDFVLSDEGQSLWLAPKGHSLGPKKFNIGRMAIKPKLYKEFRGVTSVKINPFEDLQPFSYDSKLGSSRWSALNALLGATVIDVSREKRNRGLPISEADFNLIVTKDWKDPVRRNQIILGWQH